ncbi:MAG: hypothetical protein UU85_C0008G0003 [Candidatus Wolfebacteria bacterium GW2011_GWA2_42_10]|uniref:Uncharacterized protein n=2 Tax=Candidatus Wolfeibacteriota TaxID=1752735 RepID=A0A0G0XJH6_9BACT|nr:MAG: hypothetical protein UU38_C0003G0198 [Candidatus Wolfebacteria bacterium GW2011_GWB1_41_12]KKS25049.1 MAG: hypothetical protein UU85_C0008G0003 [Candidatus Wolfebacteria bacterium GW2011_GWA2_42_10]KKT56360.1 MAG: hypothetical protein UW50_C0002G0037 [Candidatus Wolfebacteria bacterium GW2011_GWA1_44_24]
MAILIEEEKRKINWFALIVVLAIVAALTAAVYYFFFTNPPLIEVVVPGRLKMLEETSRIKLNPAEILDSPALKNLKIQVPELVPESAFNPNPFK